MTCSITMTNVSGRDVSEGRAGAIYIEGEAAECTDIQVDITTGCETSMGGRAVSVSAAYQ